MVKVDQRRKISVKFDGRLNSSSCVRLDFHRGHSEVESVQEVEKFLQYTPVEAFVRIKIVLASNV